MRIIDMDAHPPFGTDYPGVNPASDIAAVLHEDLTEEELECVFYRSAERLLKIQV